MPRFISSLAQEYERLFATPAWVVGTGVSVFAVVFAYAINRIAGMHATALAPLGRSISDVLLDAIPRLDTAFIHTEAHLMALITLCLLFVLPRYFPLTFICLASIIVTRAVFINMTHLGLYKDATRIYGSFTTFGGDLFFSGHVAIPFILALVFWDIRWMRYLYFFFMVLYGAAAVLGHYHYSIDIFAAPFIAYGVYRIVCRLFPQLVALL